MVTPAQVKNHFSAPYVVNTTKKAEEVVEKFASVDNFEKEPTNADYLSKQSLEKREAIFVQADQLEMRIIRKWTIIGGVTGAAVGGIAGGVAGGPGAAVGGGVGGLAVGAMIGRFIGIRRGKKQRLFKIVNSKIYKNWKQKAINEKLYEFFHEHIRKNTNFEDFLCPISLELPLIPVKAPDGRTYDLASIECHVKNKISLLAKPGLGQKEIRDLMKTTSPERVKVIPLDKLKYDHQFVKRVVAKIKEVIAELEENEYKPTCPKMLSGQQQKDNEKRAKNSGSWDNFEKGLEIFNEERIQAIKEGLEAFDGHYRKMKNQMLKQQVDNFTKSVEEIVQNTPKEDLPLTEKDAIEGVHYIFDQYA
jgi:hypothetical protein